MAQKWNSDSTSSEKLLLLFVTLLFNKRSFSLTELSSSACLNASKSTTLRLLRKLENSRLGILKHEKRGRESWYSLERYSGPGLAPNPESIAQLALCRDLVFHLLPEKMQEETARTIAMLSGRMKTIPGLPAASLVKGQINYEPFKDTFSLLEQAIREKIICRISYQAVGNDKVRSHLFAPLRMLASQDSLYFEGWFLEDNNPAKRKYGDPVRLALQRFQACEFTEYTSARLPPLPALRNDLLGIMDYEPFEAKIWFEPNAAAYIAERTWSRNQRLEAQEDGSIILTVVMANYNEALSWVLSFGKKAIVLEPDWFVKEARKELKEAARQYQKHKFHEEKELDDDNHNQANDT